MKFLLAVLLLVASSPTHSQTNRTRNEPELFPVAVNQKLGYIDVRGKIVIPLKFSIRDPNGYFNEEQFFKEGLAVVSDDKHSGFIDKTGSFVIQGQYYPNGHFADGLARVSDSTGKVGFIDRTGRYVIAPRFERAEDFAGNLALVELQGKWGYIDRTGRFAILNRFDDAQSFQDGLARVNIASVRRGYIDQTGKFLTIPNETEDFREPTDGLMAVKIGNKWGFINLLGQLVIAPQFEPDLDEYREDRYEGIFRSGLALVKLNGKYGYIDHSGKLAIPPKFDKAKPFQDDRARVAMNGKWGLINQRGEFVAAPRFQELEMFYEDRAVASLDGKLFGFIDRSGKLSIAPQFNEAQRFSEGLACVKKAVQVDGKTTWLWGYIDRSGQFVIKPQFTYEGIFERGLARQMIFECVCHALNKPGRRNEWGYLDRTGKFVWKSTD